MNTEMHRRFAGMGSGADTAVQLSTIGAEAAVPAVMGTTVAPTAIGSTVAGLLGISVSAAVPIVGAVIAGISIGIEAILHSGCGQTCVVTSQWANQAEGYLKQNISAYFAIPAPRPQSVQQIAMANFQAIWNTLVQQCSQPGLGTAGQNCINDRKDGGCKWKQTGQPYPGTPAVGACWNWWNGYYYPIANDTNVYNDAASAASPITNAISSLTGVNISPYLLIGVALIGGALLLQAS
jgi:hypothetical protein